MKKTLLFLVFPLILLGNSCKFVDIDRLVEKNREHFQKLLKAMPSHHKVDGKYTYSLEAKNILLVPNRHRYRSRAFDLFEDRVKLPKNHKEIFFDSNPRYSATMLDLRGSKKLFAMEE